MGSLVKFLITKYTNEAISIVKDLIEDWNLPDITLEEVFSIEVFSISQNSSTAYDYLKKNYNYKFPDSLYENFSKHVGIDDKSSKNWNKETRENYLKFALDVKFKQLRLALLWEEALSKYSKLRTEMKLSEFMKTLKEEIDIMNAYDL
jgi:acyl carrier protein phosphodiesterase